MQESIIIPLCLYHYFSLAVASLPTLARWQLYTHAHSKILIRWIKITPGCRFAQATLKVVMWFPGVKQGLLVHVVCKMRVETRLQESELSTNDSGVLW